MAPAIIALTCYGMFAVTFVVAGCVIVREVRRALSAIRKALSQP